MGLGLLGLGWGNGIMVRVRFMDKVGARVNMELGLGMFCC